MLLLLFASICQESLVFEGIKARLFQLWAAFDAAYDQMQLALFVNYFRCCSVTAEVD